MLVLPGFVAVTYFDSSSWFLFHKECRHWNTLKKPRLSITKRLYPCKIILTSSYRRDEPDISSIRLVFLRFLVGLLSNSTRADQDLKDASEREFKADSDFSLSRYVWWRIGYQLDLLGNLPKKQLLSGLMAMLFGFTCASSLTLIFGALSFLDPLIAGNFLNFSSIMFLTFYK
ncbi:hypothetical protein Gasu_13180 isoform 2 [Galdieria sulphuraria]|uniref:Uncharacterized protein n=1 Tax=Galdieria sulphuraria TaxID=130081 RepID=M2Y686_GALSU|nr:hypothetical protein Gasu_13180 isoform 2 [Galdieria sulphuraria]EME31349.1 hypothetical protein isoform 2 [Galdieria sulphuraria]|eukprot:XP_005707869.1 hypothetical protein isoform 2 [Galdieria sulphuraria]